MRMQEEQAANGAMLGQGVAGYCLRGPACSGSDGDLIPTSS